MPTDLLGRDYETFPAPEPLQTHGPARVIAMCNQKGGVGKTTSSINIAGALAQYGRRVLIVDFDPQGAATVGLGVNANTVENTIYTALFDISVDPHDVVQHTAFENIDVIPANIDLSAAEVQLVTEVGREQILNSVLRKLKSEYDLIIVDCQPSLGLLTVNALAAADGVIIPVAAEFFALRGVALLMQSIEKCSPASIPHWKWMACSSPCTPRHCTAKRSASAFTRRSAKRCSTRSSPAPSNCPIPRLPPRPWWSMPLSTRHQRNTVRWHVSSLLAASWRNDYFDKR